MDASAGSSLWSAFIPTGPNYNLLTTLHNRLRIPLAVSIFVAGALQKSRRIIVRLPATTLKGGEAL